MIAVNNLGGIRKLILGDIPNPKCAITEHDPAWCMAEAAARSFAPPEASLLQRRSVVAVVFCRQLCWCSDWHPQGVHRAAKDATLTVNGAYIPTLKGEVLRPHG